MRAATYGRDWHFSLHTNSATSYQTSMSRPIIRRDGSTRPYARPAHCSLSGLWRRPGGILRPIRTGPRMPPASPNTSNSAGTNLGTSYRLGWRFHSGWRHSSPSCEVTPEDALTIHWWRYGFSRSLKKTRMLGVLFGT